MPLPPPPARCDHCKHWDKDEQRRAGDLRVGWCHRALQWWDATQWCDSDDDSPYHNDRRVKTEFAGTKMFVQDESDYRVELYTAADFFCAHFRSGRRYRSRASRKIRTPAVAYDFASSHFGHFHPIA